jgi:pimeloyl-ACP methyl ester carboxylesterase
MTLRTFGVCLVVAQTAAAQTTGTVTVQGRSFQYDTYVPTTGTRPFPVVALGHGFSLSKDNVKTLAQELQTDGILVVAPTMTGLAGVDHSLNADIMIAALDAAVASGQADVNRFAFGGHSAGGLAAWLAASRRTQAKALVLLDPVDNNLGTMQANAVMAPTLFEFAPPASCNSQNNSIPWFSMMRAPKGRLNVAMATHCEPVEPSNFICGLACGGNGSPQRGAVFRRYARAFFNQFLLSARTNCVETMAIADQAAGTINQVDLQLGNLCGADGGVPMGGGMSGAGGGRGGGSSGTGGGMSGAGGGRAGGSSGVGGGSSSVGGGSSGVGGGSSGVGGGSSSAGGGATGTGGGAGVCNASTCPQGCCNGNVCETSSSNTCGLGGNACAICTRSQTCDMGRCTSTPSKGCGSDTTAAPVATVVALTLLRAVRRRRTHRAR